MATLALNVVPTGAVAGSQAAAAALDGVKRSAIGAEAALTGVSRNARVAGQALGLAGIAASTAFGAIAASGINSFRQQSKALAEVSTIIEGTTAELEALDAASKAFAATYGGSTVQQVQAFYQAISSGVGGVAEATAFVEEANKLAVAGVTDVASVVTLLSSSLNVYGQSGLTAAQASDVLFTAVNRGVTTVEELNGAFGRVLPVAQAAGVSFEETAAAVAALTLGGLSTAESVTGVRAILQTVIKPTQEASEAAAALGIEFDVAALQAKGFTGFMEEVVQKTGGSTDALGRLFTNTEALVPALAFAGTAGDQFASILEDMENAAGATDTAFEKVSQSLEQRFAVQVARIQTATMALGEALFTVLVPALEGAVSVVQTVAQNFDVLGVAIAALAATQIPAAVTALAAYATGAGLAAAATTAFTTALVALRAGIAFLGGPIGLVVGGLTALAGAAFLVNRRTSETVTPLQRVLMQAKLLPDPLYQVEVSARNAGDGMFALGNNAANTAGKMDAATGALERWKAAAQAAGVSIGGFGAEVVLPRPGPSDQTDIEQFVNRGPRPRPRPNDIDFGVPLPGPEAGPVAASGAGSGIDEQAAKIEDLKSAYDSLIGSLDPVIAKTQEHDRAVKTLSEALGAGVISQEQYAAAMKLVEEELTKTDTVSNQLAETFARTASQIIQNADSAADAVSALAEQLANAAFQAGFSGLFGSGTVGAALGSVGKLFGFNARGTNSWRGGMTWVGEEGPELIDLPAGTRIHSAASSREMGGGVSIAVDARGAQVGVAEQVRRELVKLLPAMQQASIATLQTSRMRGARV